MLHQQSWGEAMPLLASSKLFFREFHALHFARRNQMLILVSSGVWWYPGIVLGTTQTRHFTAFYWAGKPSVWMMHLYSRKSGLQLNQGCQTCKRVKITTFLPLSGLVIERPMCRSNRLIPGNYEAETYAIQKYRSARKYCEQKFIPKKRYHLPVSSSIPTYKSYWPQLINMINTQINHRFDSCN